MLSHIDMMRNEFLKLEKLQDSVRYRRDILILSLVLTRIGRKVNSRSSCKQNNIYKTMCNLIFFDKVVVTYYAREEK